MKTNDFQIDTDSAEPIYVQLANYMKKEISSEHWPVGSKIPSEEYFVNGLGISRGTVRKASLMLVEDNVLEKIQGKGTFVSDNSILYPVGQELLSYEEMMHSNGQEFVTRVLSSESITADSFLAEKFNISEGDPIFYLVRLRSVDDKPILLLRNWVSYARLPNIQKINFEKTGLFNAIESELGTKIKFGVREFSAVNLSEEEAKLFEVKPNKAVLRLFQTTFDDNSQPLEYSDVLISTENYKMTSILNR